MNSLLAVKKDFIEMQISTSFPDPPQGGREPGNSEETTVIISFEETNLSSSVYVEMGADEDAGLDIKSVMTSMTSVMSAEGVADPISFRVNCFAIFVGDMARGIFFPTMWNLVQILGGDQIILGFVTSSFSFGRMLVLPLFGKLSTVHGCRKVLLFTSVIFFVGTIMFAQVLYVGKPWFLILSNIVLGIGSGTLAVTRAYTSDVTPRRSRTGYMALISATQYIGTTVTPLIGSLFVVIFANEDAEVVKYNAINEFTAPAYFMAIATSTLIYLLHVYFKDMPEKHQASSEKLSKRYLERSDIANTSTCFGLITNHTLCLYGCMFLNVFVKGPMACFETLGVEFAESHFEMQRQQAGSIVAAAGFLGALNLLILKFYITQHYNDVQIIILGYSMFIIGIMLNTTLDKEDPKNNPIWMYALSMFFVYSCGYPICHVALIGYFSKGKILCTYAINYCIFYTNGS